MMEAAQHSLAETAVRNAPDVVMVLSRDGTIEFINQYLPGDEPSPVIGTSAYAYLTPEGAEIMRSAIDQACETDDVVTYEVTGPAESGQNHYYSSRVRRIGDADDARLVVFSTTVATPESAAESLRTAQRELDSSRQQLAQVQKMEAIGRLAGGVAHDFNNLLTSIISFTRFVQDDLSEGDPRRSDLSEVLRAADSASRLTRQLLSFSRRRPVEPTDLDLNELLRKIDKVLRRTVGEPVELVLLLPELPVHVRFDRSQFEQLVLNLAVNARDAMPDGGTLTIQVQPREVRQATGLPLGRYACISVTDTGSGVAEDVMEHIFEPFFTTKGEQGTGMGLSTCYGLVKQGGGDIRASSTPGAGARFEVFLPLLLSESKPASPPPTAEQPVVRGGGRRVLVVEDQPAILKTMRRSLERAGFEVLTACTAEEGLVVARENPDFTLLVTDVVLPSLSGTELLARLREARPRLKALLTSGYLADGYAPEGVEADEDTQFLPKPFSAVQLIGKVAQVVGSDGSSLG